MARTGYGWHPTLAMAAIVLSLAVQGCGTTSDSTAVRASVRSYVIALAKHDAAAICAAITSAYWSAWAGEVNGQQSSHSVVALSRTNCRRGIKGMFSRAAAQSRAVSRFVLTDIRIAGHVATARLTVGAAPRAASARTVRFIQTPGGVWRMDCCTGAQVRPSPWTTYWIPSESMEPTVEMGHRVTSDNAAIRSHPPSLGEIVVFHPPAGAEPDKPVCGSRAQGAGHPRPCGRPTRAESAETFIKRVVGLPGDRIAIVGGHVIRNGVREQEPYIVPCLSIDAAECTFPRPIVVPLGEYYMLGDNRGASDDSRFWGPVKRSWMIGVVKL